MAVKVSLRDNNLEIFAPFFLFVWNQMPLENLQTIVLP